jgi:hypothetical protein
LRGFKCAAAEFGNGAVIDVRGCKAVCVEFRIQIIGIYRVANADHAPEEATVARRLDVKAGRIADIVGIAAACEISGTEAVGNKRRKDAAVCAAAIIGRDPTGVGDSVGADGRAGEGYLCCTPEGVQHCVLVSNKEYPQKQALAHAGWTPRSARNAAAKPFKARLIVVRRDNGFASRLDSASKA